MPRGKIPGLLNLDQRIDELLMTHFDEPFGILSEIQKHLSLFNTGIQIVLFFIFQFLSNLIRPKSTN